MTRAHNNEPRLAWRGLFALAFAVTARGNKWSTWVVDIEETPCFPA